MCVPGHKQRQDLVGAVVAGDAPLYGGLAPIKHADTLRIDAEARAARLWGADWCRFSVAGSTHGNQALALAVGQPGQEDHHHPHAAPLAAARAGPGRAAAGVGAARDRRRAPGCPAAVAVATVRAALAAHPGACAVFLGDPSYVGTTGDLAGHAAAAHDAGRAADRRRRLGRAPGLPPRPAAARHRGRRRRHGDQRPQGAARLQPGRAGAGPDRPAGRRAAGPGVRGDPHHQPDRVDHGQHRRGPGAAGPGRGGAVRPAAALRRRGPRSACARCPAWASSTVPAWSRPSWSCCWPAPGPTATPSRPTWSPRACRWRWPTATCSARSRRIADDEDRVAAFTGALIDTIERHRGAPRQVEPAAAWTVEPQTMLSPREAFFARERDRSRRCRRRAGQRGADRARTRPASRCWRRAS